MVLLPVVFAALLITSAVLVSGSAIENMSDQRYMANADELAATLAGVIDKDSAERLRDQVLDVYFASHNRVTSDDWGSDEFNEYVAQFSWIEETEAFKKLYAQLRRIQDVNDVDCLYLVSVVPENKDCIYLVDAAEEDACPPGCIDKIYDPGHRVLTEPEYGFPAYLTNYEIYGWLVSAGAPVMDSEGNVICYAYTDISVDYIKEQQSSFLNALAAILAAITVFLCVMTICFVNRSVVRPVKALSGAAVRYGLRKGSSHSEFKSLDIHTGDEIESLHKSMIRMEDNINSFIDNLVITKIKLDQALSEAEDMSVLYKKQSADLADALDNVKKAGRAKTVFLSNISHEVRTPINAILGMNEMIVRESADEAILKYALDIKSSGSLLLGLINDLLDFSRIESGKLELISEEYSTSSLINDLIIMISVRAGEKDIEFITDVDKNLPSRLYGDPVRLKQCMLNILTNAVKYTHEGSVTMKVGFTEAGSGAVNIRFEVKDTGIGIKPDDMDKLLSPFERIEEGRNRSIEGTGLGLSIVKLLLSMMGTSLEIESVYGSGSVFAFSVEQKVVDRSPIGDLQNIYKRSLENNEKYMESFRAPEAVILAVDDVKMNLNVVKGLLKRTDIRIDTADDGFEAVAKAGRTKYDCILIDHRMPGMDGVETLHEIKNMKGSINENTPCIALTANAVSGAREMFLKEGFDDYISKPVEGKALERILIKYLPGDKVLLSPE